MGIDQDRCIGVIMARYHLTSDQAYRFLRQHARSSRRKLADIAARFIQAMDEVNVLSPTPESTAGKATRRGRSTA